MRIRILGAVLAASLLASCAGGQAGAVLANLGVSVLGSMAGKGGAARQYANQCYVVGITDGDTLTCLDDRNRQLTVRLDQIDAPEVGQAFGDAAKRHLSDLAFNQWAKLEQAGTDRYGRTLATVTVNGENVNKAMVRDGYAWSYRQYLRDTHYATLESEARQWRRGLWGDSQQPIYPSEWRAENATPVGLGAFEGLATQQPSRTVSDSVYAPGKPRTTVTTAPAAAPWRTAVAQDAGFKGGSCSKRTCSQMRSCAEAMYHLRQCGVRKLDRDGDGVPCESICGG